MRTLKKTLCLVLCLAMMVGLCAISASATFTDAADIENKEAVDLMTGIGIIEGYTDGSFNPTKVLNRAEAAKIIAYLLLGKTAADALPKADTKFADVTAAHWASGYVNYCVSQRIIAGKSADKFAPADTLKASEWGKMLLCALGYKDDVEGLIGSNWDFNVTRLVAKTKLFDGFNASAEMTRDSACLMAYNALTVPMVEYGNGLTVTTGDGTKVETNNQPIASGLYLADNYNLAVANVDATAANDFDRMGFRNTTTVTGVITANAANDPANASKTVLNAGTAYKIETGADLLGHFVKIYKDSKGNAKSVTDIGSVVAVAKKITANDEKTFKKTFGVSDVTEAATVYTFNAGVATTPALDLVYTAQTAVGSYVFNDEGALVAYIASASAVSLDKVTKIVTKSGEESIKIAGVGTALPNNADEDVVDAYDGIAEKDIVLVTKTGDSYVLTKAETVNGAVTKVTAAAGGNYTITIDGTDYAQSGITTDNSGLTKTDPTTITTNMIKAGATFTLYLDADGKWIACVADVAAAVAADLRYVAATYQKTVSGDKGDTVNYYAVTYNTAGEVADVLYRVGTTGQAVIDGTVAGNRGFYELSAYAASTNPTEAALGLTLLAPIGDGAKTTFDNVYVIDKDTAAINMTATATKFPVALDGGDTPYISASTKFIFIDNAGTASLVAATVKDGPVNFNYAAGSATIVYTLGKDGNYVANAVFFEGAYADAGVTAASSIYFDGAPAYDNFDSTGFTYTVYDVATGAEKTIKTKIEIAATDAGFYKYTETEDGYTTLGAYQIGPDTAYVIAIDVDYAGAYGTALHSTGWAGFGGVDVEAKDVKFVDLRSSTAKAAAPLEIETVEELIAAAASYTITFDIYATKNPLTGAVAAAFIAITSAVEK